MMDRILHAAWVIPGGDDVAAHAGWAVGIAGGRVAAVGPRAAVAEALPGAVTEELGDAVLMPGLINAHQHGRGLTQLQLGYPDLILEAWQTLKRLRGWLDPAAMVPLAAMQMLASGITAAVHANTAWGRANQPDDLERTLAAYDAVGLRAMLGVGAQDRGGLVFPAEQQADFLASLPDDLRALVGDPDPPVYATTAEETLRQFDELAAQLPGHGRITLAIAPAGPQWVSDGLFRALGAAARTRGVPLHMHALESVAQAAAARSLYPEGTLARLASLGVLGPLTSLAHAAQVTEADVRVAAETGTILVRNPASNLRLGCGMPALARWLAAGITVAVGTDNQAMDDEEDLWKELRLAARLAAEPLWNGPPRPASATLLAMVTTNGARAMGLADRIGRIAPGFAADLVALDLGRIRGVYADPSLPLLDLVLGRADARDVRMTMVDGRILYRDGRFPHLDAAAIAARAADAAAASRAAWTPAREAAVARLVEAVRGYYAAFVA
jgi:cytosine/adenosine deaminase-related metal-dependent hydrolase